MPFYEYECASCKYYTEVMQRISDPPLTKCPSCGRKALKKLVSAPVFRLKGGGWYETDFKTDKEGKRNLAGGDRDDAVAKPEESKAVKPPKEADSKAGASAAAGTADSGGKGESGESGKSSAGAREAGGGAGASSSHGGRSSGAGTRRSPGVRSAGRTVKTAAKASSKAKSAAKTRPKAPARRKGGR